MKGVSLVLAAATLASCADERPEILLWVEADYPMAANSRQVTVTIDGANEQVVPLSGQSPRCLPFSFSLVPGEETDPGATFEIVVQLERLDGLLVTRRVQTQFGDGLRELRVHFEERCAFATDCDQSASLLELPARDRRDALAEIQATSCLALPTPKECVASGGCLALAESLAPVCVVPCPEPSPVAPPSPPSPPFPPTPPSPWSCADGWERVVQDNLQYCQPWPLGVPPCAPGTARLPGDPSCRPLFGPCPTGTFPSPLPAGAQVVSATSGPSLAVALANAPAGSTLVLGRGIHRASTLLVDRPVTLLGACTAETVLELQGGEVLISAGPSRVANLTVRGAGTGLRVEGAAVTLEGLQIDAPRYEGVRGNGGALLILRDLSVRSSGGTGIRVEGSTLSAERVELWGLNASGLRISESSAELRQLAVTEVAPGNAVEIGTGSGILLRHGSRLLAEDVVIGGASDWGLFIREGSAATTRRVLLRDPSDGLGGGGRVTEGSTLTIDHLAIVGAKGVGLYVNASASIQGGDLSISDVRVANPGERGTGVLCSSRGRLALARAAVFRAARYGVFAESGCQAVLQDLELHTVGESSDGGDGVYLNAARLDLRRARITAPWDRALTIEDRATAQVKDLTALAEGRGEDPAVYIDATAHFSLSGAAIAGFDEGCYASPRTATTTLTFEDIYLEDLRGYGFRISGTDQRKAPVQIERADLRRLGGRGFDLINVDAQLVDLAVRDSGFSEPNYSGAGVALLTSRTVGQRWSITNVDDAAVVILDGRTELQDVQASGSRCRPSPLPQGCGVYSSTGLHLGIGLGRIFPETEVSVERFHVSEHQSGIRQASGLLTLRDGTLSGNRVGIISDYEGRELERLLAGVRFVDNEQDVNSVEE